MSEITSSSNSQTGELEPVLKKVAAEGHNLLNGGPNARDALIASARELIATVETPMESLLWSIWAQPSRTVATRIAVELKLFDAAVVDGDRPKTAAELSVPTGASPKLVDRISRMCVSMGMLDEKEPGLYAPNSLTHALTRPECAGGIIFCFDATQLSYAKLTEYLKSTDFQNPENPLDGPFQYGHNMSKGDHAFNWLANHPDVLQAFHRYIHGMRVHRPSWVDMYPVHEHLVQGLKLDGDASALVDVGGSTGQILDDFRKAVPEYTGRLVLQEQPDVIEVARTMDLDPRVELQAHDFFTEQPVKGARAYFMRSVLHDWSDEAARSILLRLKDVMEPGYSKILISDCVVSNEKAEWQHLALDLFMMALAASRERTESEWHELIESCGLKIAGIYSKGQGNESLIEVVL